MPLCPGWMVYKILTIISAFLYFSMTLAQILPTKEPANSTTALLSPTSSYMQSRHSLKHMVTLAVLLQCLSHLKRLKPSITPLETYKSSYTSQRGQRCHSPETYPKFPYPSAYFPCCVHWSRGTAAALPFWRSPPRFPWDTSEVFPCYFLKCQCSLALLSYSEVHPLPPFDWWKTRDSMLKKPVLKS